MNLREINEIIQQISETLTCPRCNIHILPRHIQVVEMKPNGDYLFDVACHECKAEMSLSAHVERVNSNSSLKKAKPSYVQKRHKDLPAISDEDVVALKKALRNFCGSFIEAFS